ncbi:ATP-binding protein [Solimonas terrae]|uniref:histidine kinase n=1 Tax=Solimonas terrae TaxID=1396819 RepID=A0A6M2BWY4_9GAMM|nr:ATP-binding protein [Solimonas terrae]NGY07018.1 HAMP domain-containing histidine kinase [Solimonas terrae]
MALSRMASGGYSPEPLFRLPQLSLRNLALLVAATLAIGLLASLLRMSWGHAIDPTQQLRGLEQLATAARLDAALDQSFESARLALDAEPAELPDLVQRIDATRQGLQDSFTRSGVDASVSVPLRNYINAARDKTAATTELKRSLGTFVTAFKAMQQQGDSTLAALQSADDAPLRRPVMALVSAATSYGIQSVPGNGADIDQLLATIDAASSRDHAVLSKLTAAVRTMRSAKDSLQRQLAAFRAMPTASSLQQLRNASLDYSRNEELRRERGRTMLGVYTAALFVAFGALALWLRKSFSDLDRANANLQQANEGLEQGIAERTRDLSEALDNLRMQQAQLIQSEKMASLGQMVAGVAHEINTPLGYAQSNVQTVREVLSGMEEPDAGKRESLDEAGMLLADAEHGMERISELVLTLKDFSRVDRSRTEPFNVNEALESALKICNNQLKGRIDVERDYAELPQVPCAPSELNQVFLNLMTNAAQAIEGPGLLKISTCAVDNRVEVRIRDNGCGMDPDVQAHIFEPFFTTKPIGQGTGLGLSIVFRIIENHQGQIKVQSTPGEGTEFLISLPAVPKRAASPAGSTMEQAGS